MQITIIESIAKMKEQLSNCCKASANIDCADEGTSCYICAQCKRPCDLLQTGEQVSVDDCKCTCHRLSHKCTYCDCSDKLKSEYDRLKRLDENLNKTKHELRTTILSLNDLINLGISTDELRLEVLKSKLELLEDLDK